MRLMSFALVVSEGDVARGPLKDEGGGFGCRHQHDTCTSGAKVSHWICGPLKRRWAEGSVLAKYSIV